jgi:hypothetical protein
MNRKNILVPEPIAQLQRQLEQFRSSRPARTRLPESLWQAAEELARQHGVYTVAHPLRLDYTRLKKRLGGTPSPRRRSRNASFVELIASPAATPNGCTIEFESLRGGKMRIQWKGPGALDWASLLRAWREAEG